VRSSDSLKSRFGIFVINTTFILKISALYFFSLLQLTKSILVLYQLT